MNETQKSPLRVPAEWEKHKALWTAFPSHSEEGLWKGVIDNAQNEVAEMVAELAKGQRVNVLTANETAHTAAQKRLGTNANVKLIPARFGDIWLRDTGPIFAKDENGKPIALRFQTNGWGGKYVYEYDDEVGDTVANLSNTPIRRNAFILEGGALEHDGDGTILTTRQCLLNDNRNKGWTKERAEQELCTAFGVSKILWLDEGLLNDHTDGHIDNIARFVAPATIACQSQSGADDPNAATLDRIADALSKMTDAKGRTLKVIRIPSPGLVTDDDGAPIPASHMNFIIGNEAIVVPVYGTKSQDEAVAALAKIFSNRRVIGCASNTILTGGGSFHCITQQEPE